MTFVTTEKLRRIINEEAQSADQRMLYADAFAMGCYAHLKGDKEGGLKMCATVLRTLGWHRRKTYFSDLLYRLEGNERKFVDGLEAHAEINVMFLSSAQ